MLCLETPADTRTAAMALAMGWGNRRDQSREPAFGTRDLRALLLPSHPREQVGGIPSDTDIRIYESGWHHRWCQSLFIYRYK